MADQKVSFQNIGTSIPVDNVQALAASVADSGAVPPRYIRPEVNAYPVAQDGDGELPVIDFARLLDLRFSQEESAKLHYACAEWGFFQLLNHQVPEEVIEQMKADIMEFFKLPLEEKKAFAQGPGGLQGYGQAFVMSEEQKLDWADMFFVITRPVHLREMRFWPTRPPTFRNTLSCYSAELKRVASTLMEVIAEALGIAPDRLLDIFDDMPQGVRINYYPPCPEADQMLGSSPHTDGGGGLTLLLQINDVQGLQIKNNGKWFPVRPLPGALVVNIGDILEILSNGKLNSIEHRAVINTEKERLSVATFLLPSEDAVIGPLPELVTKGCEEKYKTMSYRDFLRMFYARKLDGRSLLESLRL
ncbi:unnamed protein product [Musa hybrid cultivar]